MNKGLFRSLLPVLLVVTLFLGCSSERSSPSPGLSSVSSECIPSTPEIAVSSHTAESNSTEIAPASSAPVVPESHTAIPELQSPEFDISIIPTFSGSPYIAVNNNIPYFTIDEISSSSFEKYAPLDHLGRCGITVACIGQDLMPTEERGSIGMVKPTGWHTVKYDGIDGKYLYNRCHLIGFQLTGENANTSNLITGTRYLNIQGMLPFENMVADYIRGTGNHVMYRSTPIFENNNLLATGVLMEGWSVEDEGEGICYCVFAYNAQPGISLNYTNGDSYSEQSTDNTQAPNWVDQPKDEPVAASDVDYVLNTNTKKFHFPDCSSVDDMKEKNKNYYTGSRDELISQGYSPCKRCCP